MVSTIIVNYHSAALTRRAVASVLEEGGKSEVIVVDNTVTAEEQALLSEILPNSVTLILNRENEGFARACNRAFAAAKGEFIFLLNPDAYLLPGALRHLADTLVAHPGAGAVGPRLFWNDGRNILLPSSTYPSPFTVFLDALGRISPFFAWGRSLGYRRSLLDAWQATLPIRQVALSGGHLMLRRSALERCGGLFDERFFMFYEDSDLMHRLEQAGYSLYLAPGAAVVHRCRNEGSKNKLMEQSGPLYFEKNFHNHWLLALAARLGGCTFRLGCDSVRDLGAVSAPIKLDVPERLHSRWLFEFSPAPNFIPMLGYFGSGPQMSFPEDAWDLLGSGTYFGRISDPKKFFVSREMCSWLIK